MRLATRAVAAVCTAALLGTVAIAQEMSKEERAAQARQGLMHLFVWEAGPLFAMAKGDIAYDADLAKANAENLATLAEVDPVSLFVPGSSTDELGDKTLALPAIWENTDEFVAHDEDLRKATATLAEEAGKGLDAFRAAVGPVGRACGDCHDDFRKDVD